MATGAFHDIDLPAPEARTRATLLSVARPIPASELVRDGVNRFVAGVEWLPWPTIDHTAQAASCQETFNKLPRALPGLANQPSFVLWDSLKCGATGQNLGLLAEALAISFDGAFLSASFASELETGAGSNGLGLVGDASDTPTIVTSAAGTIAVGIARLEGYLARNSGHPGMRGVIHLTPDVLVLAEAVALVRLVGDHYETASGHLVVGDAGHTGSAAPFGQAAASATQAWIYATGDIWVARSGLEGVMKQEGPDGGAFYQPRNENRPLAEVYGLVVFDPNILAAALVNVNLA